MTWNDVDNGVDDVGGIDNVDIDDDDDPKKNSHCGPTNCQNAKRVCAKEGESACVRNRERERREITRERVCESTIEKSDSRKSGHLRRSDL